MSVGRAKRCVKNVRKNVHKSCLDAFIAEAAKGFQDNPDYEADIAIALVESRRGAAAASSGSEQVSSKPDMWNPNFRSLKRLPLGLMEKMLLHQSEAKMHLSQDKILLWKLQEKDIVVHLFEFDYSLDVRSQWPAAECHVKGIPEKVFAAWQQKNGGSQIARFWVKAMEEECNAEAPWPLGVYYLAPEDENGKITHVIHRPSGNKINIPVAIPADKTWTFSKNWSANESELVDASGYGRTVKSFLQGPHLFSEIDWVEFASRQAKLLCPGYCVHEKKPQIVKRIHSAVAFGAQADWDEMEMDEREAFHTPRKALKPKKLELTPDAPSPPHTSP